MPDAFQLEHVDLRPGGLNFLGGPPPARPPPTRLERFRNRLADWIEDLAWRIRGQDIR